MRLVIAWKKFVWTPFQGDILFVESIADSQLYNEMINAIENALKRDADSERNVYYKLHTTNTFLSHSGVFFELV